MPKRDALEMREHYIAACAWTCFKSLLGEEHYWISPNWSLHYDRGKIRDFLRLRIRDKLSRLDIKSQE